jgi:hypothetical protein
MDVALIDQDITRLNEVLVCAKLRRAEMYRHGQAHRALLAPVRRCPDEILSEIFIHWSHIEHHQNAMPWRTGSICSRWREIALRTSAVWSDIIVDTDRDRGVPRGDMLRELFRRTGVSRPISLQITNYCSPLSEFTEILPIILPTSNRWINLCLLLSQDGIKFLSPIKGALSSLESLKIESGMLDEACDVFEVAPRLFHVNVDLCGGGGITLPWNHLTDVSLGRSLSLERCLTTLSDCPNLVSCAFNGVDNNMVESSQFRNGVLHHAHLRNLKLETYVNPSSFFDCLSTPELCTFHIIAKFYDVGSFYASAANFLLRSSCTIVILTWDTVNLCPSQFGLIIRLMPELEELQVTTAQIDRKLLLDLTLNADENSNLCPRLHTIHLYPHQGIDKQVFLEFIKSRRPMRASNQCVIPLRSVRVRLIMGIKVEESAKVFLKELEILRDEGIDIVIT